MVQPLASVSWAGSIGRRPVTRCRRDVAGLVLCFDYQPICLHCHPFPAYLSFHFCLYDFWCRYLQTRRPCHCFFFWSFYVFWQADLDQGIAMVEVMRWKKSSGVWAAWQQQYGWNLTGVGWACRHCDLHWTCSMALPARIEPEKGLSWLVVHCVFFEGY